MSRLTYRLLFSALLTTTLSQAALAQAPAPASACGSTAVHYEVNTDRGLYPAPPAPGRALVFLLENDDAVSGFRKPTIRFGVDGKWIGATHGSSYFFAYVEPGKHTLCSNWQDADYFNRKANLERSLDFTVEAGKTYYFLVSNSFRGASRTATTLEQITTTNHEDLIADYEYASFHILP